MHACQHELPIEQAGAAAAALVLAPNHDVVQIRLTTTATATIISFSGEVVDISAQLGARAIWPHLVLRVSEPESVPQLMSHGLGEARVWAPRHLCIPLVRPRAHHDGVCLAVHATALERLPDEVVHVHIIRICRCGDNITAMVLRRWYYGDGITGMVLWGWYYGGTLGWVGFLLGVRSVSIVLVLCDHV